MAERRALVTGGAGFIGLHLARRLLADGWTVTVVDNLSRGVRDRALTDLATDPALTVATADLGDPAALAALGTGFTHVFHFAALLGVANVIEKPQAVLRQNVALLEAVLDHAAAQPSLERFVFPSTSEVYAGTQVAHGLEFPTPETTPLTISPLDQPRTSYLLSKIYGEALCHHSGLPWTIVRPHNFYGPRMGLSHVIPQLAQRIHATPDGGELVVYSPGHRRTFCFVDDGVDQVVGLANAAEATRATFNVGVSAPEVTMAGLAEALLAIMGRDLTIVDGGTTAGSPTRRCPDVTAMEQVLGPRPSVELADGLGRTVAWYRDTVFDGGEASAT